MAGKYYWIKERHNPQFDKPYFTAMGNITKKKADEIENGTLYGFNLMHKFETKEAYNLRLEELGIS